MFGPSLTLHFEIFPSVIVGDNAGMAKLWAARAAEVVRKAVRVNFEARQTRIGHSHRAEPCCLSCLTAIRADSLAEDAIDAIAGVVVSGVNVDGGRPCRSSLGIFFSQIDQLQPRFSNDLQRDRYVLFQQLKRAGKQICVEYDHGDGSIQ